MAFLHDLQHIFPQPASDFYVSIKIFRDFMSRAPASIHLTYNAALNPLRLYLGAQVNRIYQSQLRRPHEDTAVTPNHFASYIPPVWALTYST